MKQTVQAYITRVHQGVQQILVFKELSCPEASIRIPGGTLESDEREEEALYRIIEEESGLVFLRFLQKVDTHVIYRGSLRHSEEVHTFQVESLETPASRWKHTVSSFGETNGKQYDYYWAPVNGAIGMLSDVQARGLDTLISSFRKAS